MIPWELIGQGGIVTILLAILAFFVQWLIKSFGNVTDKVMADCSKREEMLRSEIINMRQESKEERETFFKTLDKYNDNLEDIAGTMKSIQKDIENIKNSA